MGLFSKKSQSYSVDDLLAMKDSEINKILKQKKTPVRSAKELRQMSRDERRQFEGEKGFGAIRAVMQQQEVDRRRRFQNHQRDAVAGRDPHAITKMKAEDPKAYQALVEREYERQKRAGLL